jgi:Flp pilus assembly protein TadG
MLLDRTRGAGRPPRRGVAAVELALLLPLLAFLFIVAVDYARLFYFSLTVQNCARNGAMYASDPTGAIQSPYASTEQAALSDAGNLSPTPTVTSRTVTDSTGTYAEVTVTYQFKTITSYPGIPNTVNLTRTVKMRMTRDVPYYYYGDNDDDD